MFNSKAYADIFGILSEFYKFPNQEFFDYINDRSFQQEMGELIRHTELNFDIRIVRPFVNLKEMKSEYTRLFIGITGTAAIPVESVYKIWTTDESAAMSFAKSKGYLMGDSALHVQHLLEMFQMEVVEELGKKPDHISVLLELLAYFIEHRSLDETWMYIQDHFDWLGDFKTAIEELEGHEFYKYVTDLLIELIDEYKGLLRSKLVQEMKEEQLEGIQ
ncbi:hypothetical protein BHU72_04775 [Desulfuribacillus stibiiarsenatis]|uniref:Uncharacterized protein n=1 Tax=Desulfuribacillus stibiiarsenatis TaxID=1390249 RepID=A0A1E5L5I9_9FIRM|nr:molecular chaperone TorD family protein [Desulfuribacillus stibiiarsenatis]OEH85407.1 hypothetical protein BHU72_04775 [Desulfuribacillus stibiiarsenatis]